MASLAGQEPGTGEGPVRQARKCSQVCFADSAVDWTLLVAGKVSPEPKGAGDVLHRRHRRRRWLPARIMLVSKESGHHGMNAFDHRTPSIPEEISEHPPVMVFGDASQPRSFGERRHKKRFRRLQRHAAVHPPRASNGLMVILDRPSMPPTFPVRPTNENDHSALDPPVKSRLSYFRGNDVPRHNGSDEQKE